MPDLSEALQQKWAAFNDALRNKDVEKALTYISEHQKAKYRTTIQALLPQMPTIVDNYTSITLTDAIEYYIQFLVGRY